MCDYHEGGMMEGMMEAWMEVSTTCRAGYSQDRSKGVPGGLIWCRRDLLYKNFLRKQGFRSKPESRSEETETAVAMPSRILG